MVQGFAHVPVPLRTQYPPTRPVVDGFFTDQEEHDIHIEIDNLLVDVANWIHSAQHCDRFIVAKTYLNRVLDSRNLTSLPVRKRRRLQQSSCRCDADDEDVDEAHVTVRGI